jgi:hypothetical protein
MHWRARSGRCGTDADRHRFASVDVDLLHSPRRDDRGATHPRWGTGRSAVGGGLLDSAGPSPSPPPDALSRTDARFVRWPSSALLPIVARSLLPRSGPMWTRRELEIVAAVRPRLAPLKRQLDPPPDWLRCGAGAGFRRSHNVGTGGGCVGRVSRRWIGGSCRLMDGRLSAESSTRHSGGRIQRAQVARSTSRAGRRAARYFATSRQRGLLEVCGDAQAGRLARRQIVEPTLPTNFDGIRQRERLAASSTERP